MVKNDLVTLTIEDMSDTGEGIGHVEGVTLFVKHTVPGDVVRAKVLKMKKTYGFAKVEELITPGPGRVAPRCSVAAPCGGCQLQFLSYEEQLKLKQKRVQDCITRIGGFSDVKVEPVLGMEDPWSYRNKGQFPVGRGKDGKPVLGFYAGHTHSIVATEHCDVMWPGHESILAAVREYLIESGAQPYDEESHTGLVRHVLMRYGKATGQILVCLVINGNKLPKSELLVSKLTAIPGMTGICLNVNTDRTNVILGKKVITLYGTPYITDYIGDVSFRISPLSFYQVNSTQTKVLYDTALAFAGLTGDEVVWDLYCGIGTISLFLAKNAKHVYGVEIVPEAIRDAKENAERNGIANATFYVGAAEEVLPKHPYPADVIVVDPPRKGCDGVLLDTMLQMAPERIVYVSCDPATLARDLKVLCGGVESGEATAKPDGAVNIGETQKGEASIPGARYRIEKVQPVDMFGGSVHVETVVRLVRK